jgi:hypothetical protein
MQNITCVEPGDHKLSPENPLCEIKYTYLYDYCGQITLFLKSYFFLYSLLEKKKKSYILNL